MRWSLDSSTFPERTFTRHSAGKWPSEYHKQTQCVHLGLPCSTEPCTEQRTQLNALICIANGQWNSLVTTSECSTRVCTSTKSMTSASSDMVTTLQGLRLLTPKSTWSKHLLAKHIATLGTRPQVHDSREVRLLNRVLRWVVPPYGKAPERMELEADPRHAELLIQYSSLLSNSRGVNTARRTTKRQFANNSTCTARCHFISLKRHGTPVLGS